MRQDPTLKKVLNELNKITHDLNNSMFVVNASVSLLKATGQYDDATLSDIEKSGHQATKLIAQLVALSNENAIES